MACKFITIPFMLPLTPFNPQRNVKSPPPAKPLRRKALRGERFDWLGLGVKAGPVGKGRGNPPQGQSPTWIWLVNVYIYIDIDTYMHGSCQCSGRIWLVKCYSFVCAYIASPCAGHIPPSCTVGACRPSALQRWLGVPASRTELNTHMHELRVCVRPTGTLAKHHAFTTDTDRFKPHNRTRTLVSV